MEAGKNDVARAGPLLSGQGSAASGEAEGPARRPLPPALLGLGTFCKLFWMRIWQLLLYTAFVVPPAALTGWLCASLLFCIKLATAFRDGTCGTNDFAAFKDTSQPLIACTEVVGARRWLLFLLSFSGLAVAALYSFAGNANAAGGMGTILGSIRRLEAEMQRISEAGGAPAVEASEEFKGLVSLRMCPLVWLGTVSSHLCGGSVGREGSALQMAAPVFSAYSDFLENLWRRLGGGADYRMSARMRRAGLVAAIASGFSGVFGVPVAGTVFAVEVLRVGELAVGEALTAALVGAFVSDWTCRCGNLKYFGFEGHTRYDCPSCRGQPQNWGSEGWGEFINLPELLAVVPAAVAFGLAGWLFEWMLGRLKGVFGSLAGKVAGEGRPVAKALLTPFLGGWAVVALYLLLCVFGSTGSLNFAARYDGTSVREATFPQAYLGLSVYEPGVSISSCFVDSKTLTLNGVKVQPLMWYSWLLKLVLTTTTLAAGFKGGEVTPLFFIGAALGNVSGKALGQDTQLFSALGFVSVFAAAANTPVACTFMAVELFGGAKALPYLLSCYLAFLVSNARKVGGIYPQAQPRGSPNAVTPFSRGACTA